MAAGLADVLTDVFLNLLKKPLLAVLAFLAFLAPVAAICVCFLFLIIPAVKPYYLSVAILSRSALRSDFFCWMWALVSAFCAAKYSLSLAFFWSMVRVELLATDVK